MLHYKTMEWENFGSFEGYHKFNFASTGQHLITATNLDHEGDSAYTGRHSVGSGKSTLTTVPYFTLYGDVTKKLNKDDIINKKVKKNLKSCLEFSVNDTDYRIERYRKHKQGKNGVFLYESIGGTWTDQTQSDINLTQQEINKIILVNQETYLKTSLLSREDLQQFLDYRPHERWKIFESIIQLDKMKRYQDLILKKRKNQTLTINKTRADISAKQTMINHLKTQVKDFKDDQEFKISNINQEIEDLNYKLKTLVSYGSTEIFIQKIYQIETIIYLLKEKRNELQNITNTITTTEKKKTNYQTKITNYQKQLNNLEKQLDNIQKIKCDNCGAIQNKDSYELQIEQYNEGIKERQDEIEHFNTQLNNLLQEDYETQKEKIEKEIQELKTQLSEIDFEKEFKEKVYEAIKNKTLHNLVFEIQELNNKLSLKNKELEDNMNSKQIDKLEKDIKVFEKELNKLAKCNKKDEEILEELEYLEDILDIRQENSIKQYAVSTVMPVFNELMRQNLDLTFDDQLTLILDLLFNETIIYNREKYSYHELSTGEKTKVNLSINFAIFDAMRLNVMNTSAIFLDEILTNLDYPSIAAFIKMINEKYTMDSAVYTITHQPDAIELLNPESITTVIKEDGCSRIELN